MKNIIVLIFISFSLPLYSSECDKFNLNKEDLNDPELIARIPLPVIAHYQQGEVLEKDILGDFSLLKKAKTASKKIFWTLKNQDHKIKIFEEMVESGKGCAEELFSKTYNQKNQDVLLSLKAVRSNDLQQVTNSHLSEDQKKILTSKLEAHKIYVEGHQNPIKTKKFVLMVNQIMIDELENGITPKYGKIHDWSNEFKKSSLAKKSVLAKFGKLLIALSRGETSQYLISGTEERLEEWILSNDLNSIYPHDMLKSSYQINNGDMYLTLLTIENVLNRYWRINDRENLPITKRLKPIINSFGGNGDKFGSWYHLFGIILYGYAEGPISGKIIGTIESMGSHILGKFEDEKQEDYINSVGGIIGGKIAHSIKNLTFEKIKSDSTRLSADYYLDLNEDFSERLENLFKDRNTLWKENLLL